MIEAMGPNHMNLGIKDEDTAHFSRNAHRFNMGSCTLKDSFAVIIAACLHQRSNLKA